MVKTIAIVGPFSCGKTKLIERYIKKRINNSYCSTIISDVHMDHGKNVLWDTPGNQRWVDDAKIAVKRSSGIIACFTPSVESSFSNMIEIIDTLDIGSKPLIFAATKTDLEFSIKETWSNEARIRNAKIIPTSAKNGEGVARLFKEILVLATDVEIVLSRYEYATEQLGTCINYTTSFY